jgi:hypothetical protein
MPAHGSVRGEDSDRAAGGCDPIAGEISDHWIGGSEGVTRRRDRSSGRAEGRHERTHDGEQNDER